MSVPNFRTCDGDDLHDWLMKCEKDRKDPRTSIMHDHNNFNDAFERMHHDYRRWANSRFPKLFNWL
jgi:hypothetical protein